MNFNLFSTYSLCRKEVFRFLKVYNQTLIAPSISALTFLLIFIFALNDSVKKINNIPFAEFMSSGLIIMTIVQNSFANTSSVLTAGKVTGNIVDYLIPPFSPLELIIGLSAGAILRGLFVGCITTTILSFFVKIHVFNFSLLIFYTLSAAGFLALLGILAGLIADSFDQLGAITSYVVTPLSFLSGTFYSVKNLPPVLYKISHCNPFFYMIDGFRYSLTGYHDGCIKTGMILLSCTIAILTMISYQCFKTGWRIKT